MTFEPQITFRNMSAMTELEEAVVKEVEGLERFFPRIVGCHVTIAAPGRREHSGLFSIQIDLAVPGEKLIVKHSPDLRLTRHNSATAEGAPETPGDTREAMLALHQAFHETRRRLQDYVRRLREPSGAAARRPAGEFSA